MSDKQTPVTALPDDVKAVGVGAAVFSEAGGVCGGVWGGDLGKGSGTAGQGVGDIRKG